MEDIIAEQSKSQISKKYSTPSNGTSESPNTQKGSCSRIVNSEKKSNTGGDDSEPLEEGVPKKFSEMERQIFVAHKNAIKVEVL